MHLYINKHDINDVSKVDRVYNPSLIYSRVNRRAVDENVSAHFIHPDRLVDIRVICNHNIKHITIAIVGEVNKPTICDIIVIMYQHMYYYKVHSVRSSRQIENFKNYVDDKSIILGGEQYILTTTII